MLTSAGLIPKHVCCAQTMAACMNDAPTWLWRQLYNVLHFCKKAKRNVRPLCNSSAQASNQTILWVHVGRAFLPMQEPNHVTVTLSRHSSDDCQGMLTLCKSQGAYQKKKQKKKKKKFTGFGQPTRLITCANDANDVICSCKMDMKKVYHVVQDPQMVLLSERMGAGCCD